MLSTSKKFVSQHSKRTRGKLASKLCHSSTTGVTRSISLVFELWKLELIGGTAVDPARYVCTAIRVSSLARKILT